jgi:hypothetical protein
MLQADKIAAAVGFLISGGLTGLCVSAWIKGRQTEMWLKRSGKIIESAVHSRNDADRNTSYSPRIRYEYAFNEVKHIGNEIYHRSSPVYQTDTEARNFVNKYPVGSTVEIRVNPRDVSESVLIPGALPKIYILIATGVLGMIGMLALYFK